MQQLPDIFNKRMEKNNNVSSYIVTAYAKSIGLFVVCNYIKKVTRKVLNSYKKEEKAMAVVILCTGFVIGAVAFTWAKVVKEVINR